MCCPDDDDADDLKEVEATNDQQPWNDLHRNPNYERHETWWCKW